MIDYYVVCTKNTDIINSFFHGKSVQDLLLWIVIDIVYFL